MQGEPRTTSPLRDRLGPGLGGALLLLLPVFWLPGFHEGFVVAKLALAAVLGTLAHAALSWRDRHRGDPLARLRLVFVLGGSVLLVRSAFAGEGFPHHLAAWLPLLVLPWLLVEAGAGLAGTPGGGRRLLEVLLASAIPVALVGCARRDLGWFAGLPDRTDVGLAATIGNSNALAEYAAPLAAAALPVLLHGGAGGSLLRRAVPGLGGLAALVLVVRSDSRGGWLALLAGGALGLLSLLSDGPSRAVRRGALAVAGVVVLGAALVLFLPAADGLRARLASVGDPGHRTNAVRLDVWAGTAELWTTSPWIGVGAGRFPLEFPQHRRAREWRLSGADTRVESPHQEPLWILAEGGLLGGLVAAVALVIALRGWLRARRSEAGERRLLAHATAAAGGAFLVVALVRSPLHHACGPLAIAALTGGLLATRRAERPAPLRTFGAHALVLLFALAAALEVGEDRRLEEALEEHRAADLVLGDGDATAVTHHLERASVLVRDLANAPVESVPRLYRTALLARDLARVRRGLARAGLADRAPLLLDERDVVRLLDRVLELAPFHLGAIVARAELDLSLGQVAAAVHRLEDAARALPRAPRLRVNLASIFSAAGQHTEARRWIEEANAHDPLEDRELRRLLGLANLSLGGDVASFGRLLDAPRHPERGSVLEDAESRAGAGDPGGAADLLLLHLADHPGDVAALHYLAELALGPLKEHRDLAPAGPRAIARQRLLTARDALADGELRVARINVRQALGKDPALLDAYVVRAALRAREGHLEEALEDLAHLRAEGIGGEVLRARVLRTPDLLPLLEAGHLDRLLGPS